MLPIKLRISDEFLQEEERNGFIISSEMKELWAVSLDLVRELLDFCSNNNIQVFAGYGTLLGAVRHDGFIPWDNDVDLMMKRKDYDRFCRIANFDFPYFLQTEKTDRGFSRGFARLRNSMTTAVQIYERNMKITYNQDFYRYFPS